MHIQRFASKIFTRGTIQSARVDTAQKKLVDHQLRFVNDLKKTTFPPTTNQAASPLALRILNFQTHHWRSNSLSGYLQSQSVTDSRYFQSHNTLPSEPFILTRKNRIVNDLHEKCVFKGRPVLDSLRKLSLQPPRRVNRGCQTALTTYSADR